MAVAVYPSAAHGGMIANATQIPTAVGIAYGCTYDLWSIRRLGDAGVLRVRRSQSLVRARICRGLRSRVALWFPAGGLAVRRCRGGVGDRRLSTVALRAIVSPLFLLLTDVFVLHLV